METVHIMKYIFPRQFNLHNVFTSETDFKETAQTFKDYMTRELEIRKSCGKKHSIPRRLRGLPFHLIARLRKRHNNCSYAQLLEHHCPMSRDTKHQSTVSSCKAADHSFTELASSSHSVLAFCQAVVNKVVPSAAWGAGEAGLHNKRKIMRSIDVFVKMRKFECPTLFQVMEGIKVYI